MTEEITRETVSIEIRKWLMNGTFRLISVVLLEIELFNEVNWTGG